MQKNQITPVALITGAAKRIGAEIAEYLHLQGLNIIIHYHTSEKEAKALCEKLNQKRLNSAVILQADLCVTSDFDAVMNQVMNAWGRLDVLVNNASRFYRSVMGQVTEPQWDDLITSNTKAPFFLSQAAAPYLAKQQGCIINITDIHGERPMRDYSVYCISKAGLIMLTKALAKELGPDVRVNAISPGPILWPEGENELSDLLKEKLIQRTVLQRSGSSIEIAKTVFFLISSDYMTGQVLSVDGGRSLLI